MVLRHSLLALSRSDRVKHLVTTMPVSSSVVARYVPGESTGAAVQVVDELVASGRLTSLDFLGEDTLDRGRAEQTVTAYLDVLAALSARGLAGSAEVSVKLSAIGLSLPGDGEKIALDHARRVCHAARNAGTTVTLDMEDHTLTDATLEVLRDLRGDYPDTGAV
ncbi:MAG: proline dehydrogenase, partial [Nocardioidaceae bacterium]|nr:proline dehydrogenase [Nocardioidaceae bacterium]